MTLIMTIFNLGVFMLLYWNAYSNVISFSTMTNQNVRREKGSLSLISCFVLRDFYLRGQNILMAGTSSVNTNHLEFYVKVNLFDLM